MSRQTIWVEGDILTATALNDEFDELYSTLAASGANSDITSLAGLTTPLSVAQGGSGAATLTDHGPLIGSGTGAITAMAALAAGSLIQGVSGADPAALEIGTANHKLFVNAAGNAAEWAKGLGQITSTRDMTAESGSVEYTGMGFQPNAALVIAGTSGATYQSASIGFHVTADVAIINNYVTAAGVWRALSGNLINVIQATGKQQFAAFNSWLSDGIKVDWVKIGTPAAETLNIFILGWR
jgi:hypothetical protein